MTREIASGLSALAGSRLTMAPVKVQYGAGGSGSKMTKRRNKMVPPALRKIRSHSANKSLDLDRPWEEQPVEQLGAKAGAEVDADAGASAGQSDSGPKCSSRRRHVQEGGLQYGSGVTEREFEWKLAVEGTRGGRGGRDVRGDRGGLEAGAGSAGSDGGIYHHRRQTSTGSGSRAIFVHPFQQTPRTSTPTSSFANSSASFDVHDYSTTISRKDDVEYEAPALSKLRLYSPARPHPQSPRNSPIHSPIHASTPPLHHLHHSHPSHPSQAPHQKCQSSSRSQRTSSFSDISQARQLRISTLSPPGASGATSRLARGVVASCYSDVQVSLSELGAESPTGSSLSPASSPLASIPVSPAGTMAPLRSSFDSFPRLRSRSELDTTERSRNIREERRRFEEKEQKKQEKFEREQVRERERRDNKEAARFEKESARKLSVNDMRSPPSRRNTPTASVPPISYGGRASFATSGYGANMNDSSSGSFFAATAGSGYGDSAQFDDAPPTLATDVNDVHFTRPRRGHAAKRKTQSYWHGFLLWLRTKLLRLGAR